MMDGPELRNAATERMKADQVALGMMVRLCRTGEVAKVAASSGHDFLFIDMQHGAFTTETVSEICQVAHGCGVAPLVRIRNYCDLDAPRLLDAGVMGIVVPDVNTAEQARTAVQLCRFPPTGRRSVGAGYPIFGYRKMSPADAMAELEGSTLIICMIETVEGLANVDEIGAVEGVDVLHVGCNDLLTDMGSPGEFGGTRITEAVDRVIDSSRKNGKFAGLGGDKDLARQAAFIKNGIRFVTTHSDVAFLMSAATQSVDALRKA